MERLTIAERGEPYMIMLRAAQMKPIELERVFAYPNAVLVPTIVIIGKITFSAKTSATVFN